MGKQIDAVPIWCLGQYIQSTLRLINERWQLPLMSHPSVAIFVVRSNDCLTAQRLQVGATPPNGR